VLLHRLHRPEDLVAKQTAVAHADLLAQVAHEAGQIDEVLEVGDEKAVLFRNVLDISA